MLIYGIFTAVSNVLLLNKITSSIPSNLGRYIFFAEAILFISGLIGVYLIWLILAEVFHLISSLFYSEGTFKRTFEFVGYGFLPLIFSSIVNLGAIYTAMPSLNFLLNDPSIMHQNTNQMLANPILQVSQAATIVFTLWSAYIWIFAVKNAMKITTKKASIAVGIPVSAIILYSGYNLIIHVI